MKAITISGKKLDLTEVATITVVSDNIDSAKFTVPKTYDGVSLATGVWYLRYALTDGSGTSILLTSAVVGDNVEIIWPIEGGVVSKHGQVTIQLICLNDGIVFQSLPGTITVSRQVAPSGEPSADPTIWAQYLVLYQTALVAAEAAQTAAELAETGAVTAQGLAEDARDAAVVAKNAILNDTDFIAVAAQLDDIATVAGIAADITIVAAGISDIDRVEDIAAEITTVAGISADVTTVAGISANVTTVAGDTVAINTVAGDKANIDIVAGVSTDVTAVAGVATEVTALGARTTELDALYAEIDQIAVKANQAVVDTLNADDSTEGSVLKSIKDNAENATFTPAVGSGIASTILKDAVNEVGTDVEALKSDKADKTELSTVKVKTSENDLAIQAIHRDQNLANQSEAKISVSDYGIVALPKNATGNLKMKREGLTARNISPFKDATLTDTNVNLGTISIVSGHKYWIFRDYSYVGTADVDTGRLRVNATDGLKDICYNTASNLITATFNATARTLYMYKGTATSVTSNNTRIIDLTAIFGSGNEPTADQCNNIFPTYFADTKNVPMTGRYRGTDLDGVTTHDLYLTAPEGRSVQSAKDSAEVQDGKLVHVKRVGSGALSAEKLLNGDFSAYSSPDWTSWTRAGVGASNIIAGVGNKPRWYATGAGADAYLQQVSRLTVGKLYKVIVDATVVSGKFRVQNSASMQVVATGVYTFYFIADSTTCYIDDTGTITTKDFTVNSLAVKEIAITAGTPLAIASQTQVYDDGTTGYYQLATPIITPIDSDGSLPAGASVLWEPAIPDVGIYTDKFDILDTDHPIASIDKLYKVDFATGVQTLLTNAVVAGDGLSFTSASLTDGDLVNVIYFYSVANPEGLTTVGYLNSNVVVADSANGKYYKYKPTITNGAIASWTITEVV